MDKFKWKPWEMDRTVPPPITEPPCKHCKNFKPKHSWSKNGKIYLGVEICASPEQYQDFSCFEAR